MISNSREGPGNLLDQFTNSVVFSDPDGRQGATGPSRGTNQETAQEADSELEKLGEFDCLIKTKHPEGSNVGDDRM